MKRRALVRPTVLVVALALPLGFYGCDGSIKVKGHVYSQPTGADSHGFVDDEHADTVVMQVPGAGASRLSPLEGASVTVCSESEYRALSSRDSRNSGDSSTIFTGKTDQSTRSPKGRGGKEPCRILEEGLGDARSAPASDKLCGAEQDIRVLERLHDQYVDRIGLLRNRIVSDMNRLIEETTRKIPGGTE